MRSGRSVRSCPTRSCRRSPRAGPLIDTTRWRRCSAWRPCKHPSRTWDRPDYRRRGNGPMPRNMSHRSRACYGGRPTSEPAPRWRRSLELGTSTRSRPSSRAPIPPSPNGRVSSPRWNSFPRLTSTGSQQQQAVCGRPRSVRRHFGAATPSGLRGWPGCSKPQWRCTSSTATPIARSAAATTACTASASRNSGERSSGCAPKQAKLSPPAVRRSVPSTRHVKPSGRFRRCWAQRRTQTQESMSPCW